MNAKLEKIARMEGKTTYKDFRQGFASRSLAGDSDADIKMALGMAQRQVGALAVQVLETRYASTLKHERALRRAWDRKVREDAAAAKTKRGSHDAAVQRMGAALAIRRLAGAHMIQHEVAEYAWMLCVRRETLDEAMRAAGAWLDGLCSEAEQAFIKALSDRSPSRSSYQRP
jgi:hypothetical protein